MRGKLWLRLHNTILEPYLWLLLSVSLQHWSLPLPLAMWKVHPSVIWVRSRTHRFWINLLVFPHSVRIVLDFRVFGEARNVSCKPNCIPPLDSDNVAPPGNLLDAATYTGLKNLILLFQTGFRTLQKRGGEGDQGETRSSLKSWSTVCEEHWYEGKTASKNLLSSSAGDDSSPETVQG